MSNIGITKQLRQTPSEQKLTKAINKGATEAVNVEYDDVAKDKLNMDLDEVENGADITSTHTSNDTSNVNGVVNNKILSIDTEIQQTDGTVVQADKLKYVGAGTVESLKPAESGADITSTHESATVASIAGHNVSALADITSAGSEIEDAVTHKSLTDNPHEVNKTDVGLSNVDNLSAAEIRDDIVFDKLEEDVFPVRMSCIRNEEMNNLLATSSGTEITITSINTTTNTIVLSWVPYIDTIFSPTTDQEWALMNLENTSGSADPARDGDYEEAVKINSGTYSTKTVIYDATDIHGLESNWSAGDKVMFYNPFESGWEWSASNPIIEESGTGWRQDYVNTGALFQKSDETWVMLVNGHDGSGDLSIGAFSSSNMITWSVLNSDNAVFTPSGTTDWREDEIYCSSTVLKLKSEDRYIMYISGYSSTDTKWRIGWVKFDEDLSAGSIEYSSGEIIDSSGSSAGMYAPSVVRYGSQYRLIYTDRVDNANPDSATGGWKCREALSDTAEGTFIFSKEIFAGLSTNDGIYYSNHSDSYAYFLFNNRLYCFVGGTSRYLASGTRANRAFGLMYFDEKKGTPAWKHDPFSPIFFNPWYGEDLWGSDYDWCDDHIGGAPCMGYNKNDGKLYMYFTSNAGSDSYKIGLITLDIQSL